jgi:hypothetical protein
MRIIITIFTFLMIAFVLFVTSPPAAEEISTILKNVRGVDTFEEQKTTPESTGTNTDTPTSKESSPPPQGAIEEASDRPFVKLPGSIPLNRRWGMIRSDWEADPSNPINFDESDWVSAEEIFKRHILSVYAISTPALILGRVFKLSSKELIYLSYFEETTHIHYAVSAEVSYPLIANLPITIDPNLAKLNRIKAPEKPENLPGDPLPLADEGTIIDVGQSVLILNGDYLPRTSLYSMGIVSKISNPDAPPLVYDFSQWWTGDTCKRTPEDKLRCDQKKFDFIVEAQYLTYELGSPVFDLKSQTVIGVVAGVVQREHSDEGAAQQIFVQSIDRFRKQQ